MPTYPSYVAWLAAIEAWFADNPQPGVPVTPPVPPAPPVTPPAGPQPTGVTGTWNLIFDDEFAGSTLDAAKWAKGWFGTGVTQPVGGTSESAAYDPAQVAVSGGFLNITTKASPVTVNAHSYPYRSGLISSNGKFQFTYGYAEARINLPASSAGKIANWPAWWTDGQSWPGDGEIDIMEGMSGLAQYHAHSPSGGPGMSVSGDFTGWHTYGVNWQPGTLTFYYDGRKVGTLAYDRTSPNYLIVNYAMGAGNPILANATMQVDYVRVWQ